MKRCNRVMAFIAAALLLLQSTVGPFAGLWTVPALARDEVRLEDLPSGEVQETTDAMETATEDPAEEATEDTVEEETQGASEDAVEDAKVNTSGDTTYSSGDKVSAFELEEGNTLKEGVVIDMMLPKGYDGEVTSGRIYNYNSDAGTKFIFTYSEARGDESEYVTDRKYEVKKVEKDEYTASEPSKWSVKIWLAEVAKGEAKTSRSGDEIDVSDLEIGDIVVSGTYLAKGTWSDFRVYLDGTDLEITLDEYGTYEMPDTARLVGKGADLSDASVLNLAFETVDKKARVDTEEGLLAAFNQGDMITLDGDIALTGPLVIDDGKSHAIKLAGHGIYRSDIENPDQTEAFESIMSWMTFIGLTPNTGSKADKATGSVIILRNGSELTIEDKVGDTVGWIGSGYADQGGGVLVDRGCKFYMTGGAIMENSGTLGGGIYVGDGSKAELKKVTVSKNNSNAKSNAVKSKAAGGGIYVEIGGTCILKECVVEGNYAYEGGGISTKGTLMVTDSEIKNNTSIDGNAGGINSIDSATTIKNTSIEGNISGNHGGGVLSYGDITYEDCTISGNSATAEAGGIWAKERDDDGAEFLGSNKIEDNVARVGAGIFITAQLEKKKTRPLNNLTVTGNCASNNGDGGGIVVGGSDDKLVVTLRNTIVNNNYANRGGGIYTYCETSFTDCEITGNMAQTGGGGVFAFTGNAGKNIILKNTTIGGNIAYFVGGGIYISSSSSKSKLVLDGGKIEVSANISMGVLTKDKDTTEGTATENNAYIDNNQKIVVTGTLSEGSKIGITYTNNFTEKTATDGYGEYNDAPIDDYFSYDGVDHKVKRDDEASEVELVEKVHSTAKRYTVKVKITVTDDADDWDDAYLYVYGRGRRGIDEEKQVWKSGNIKSSVDNGDDVYDSPEIDCGDSFPSKINVYAKFGGGWIHRDWEADVKIWVNGVNCGSRHIAVDVWGNTADKGKADNYIAIAGDKYPYPESLEVEQAREIDPSDEDSKKIKIIAVDQYGMKWEAPGSDYFKMENISFPGEDTIKSLDNKGLEFSLDTTKDSVCHNSKYVIKYKSGSNYKEWVDIPVTVRFISLLKLKIRMGNDEDGYQDVETKTGKQNKTFTITAPEPPTGYKLKSPSKEGVCSVIPDSEEGKYNFTFMTESVTLTFETEPIKYSIVYDKNTSDATMVTGRIATTSTYYNQDVVLAKNTFKSKAGYIFAGWNTAPDGSGTSYTESEVVRNLSATHREQVTLYAQWQDDAGNRVTASLFSDGKYAVWAGLGVIVAMAAVLGCVVVRRRKKSEVE